MTSLTKAPSVHANAWGERVENPSVEDLHRFLAAHDPDNLEFGSVLVTTWDHERLEYRVDGRLVHSKPWATTRHLAQASKDLVVERWSALIRDDRNRLDAPAWRDGDGFVADAEYERRWAAYQLRLDRRFFDGLGPERPEVPCRATGCRRGAVEYAIHCRAHHYEHIVGRPCPFAE